MSSSIHVSSPVAVICERINHRYLALKGLVAFVGWWKERFLHICLWLRYIYIWLQSYHSYNHMNKDVNKPYGLSLWQHRSKFEEYFQMAKIFLLPETDFLTDRSSYIQIPPPPLPKIPKDDFALLSTGGRSGITLFTQSRNKVNQTWILFSSTQTHFQHD